MTDKPLSEAKARAAFNAVLRAFKSDLEPMTIDGESYGPLYEPPTLYPPGHESENGWAISWEEGPDEFAYLATSGGTSESDEALFASASAEFGIDVKPRTRQPVKWPAGVYAEPLTSWSVGLYRD